MTAYDSLIPINVITGFLGSGKTTLLARLLKSPSLQNTAVLINEFGEVGLDHQLIEHAQESTLLLENGCLCCAIRDDLKGALRDLFSRRDRSEIPPFQRVVIETSGLADPTPIAYTILTEPVLQHHYRLGNIVAVVDAINGVAQLERHPESIKQVAVADRLVLTKTGIGHESDLLPLRVALRRINAAAPLIDIDASPLDPESLLARDLYDEAGKRRETADWLVGFSDAGDRHDASNHDHSDGVTSFCLWFDGALDWAAFGLWMSMLLNRHGDQVLRIKGMLNVVGVADPVLVNGVQHIVHPPTHMTGWPDADHRSRLIFIVQDLDQRRIEESLSVFNALVNRPVSEAAAPVTASA
jgi:G3E family GTPase